MISDATKCNGDLEHREHVVAIALLCALDTISSYGYGARSGKQIPEFMQGHFSAEYHSHAQAVLYLYRHEMVHSWNLFKVSITPGNEPISSTDDTLSFGLLNFFDALTFAAADFLERLEGDANLQHNTLKRYEQLRSSAKA